jgi:hypothetical protein
MAGASRLALAAQAFLLTIATAKDGTTFTRATSASLGFFTALAATDLSDTKNWPGSLH